MGEALEHLSRSLSTVERHADGSFELRAVPSRRSERSATRRSARYPSPSRMPDVVEEAGSPWQLNF